MYLAEINFSPKVLSAKLRSQNNFGLKPSFLWVLGVRWVSDFLLLNFAEIVVQCSWVTVRGCVNFSDMWMFTVWELYDVGVDATFFFFIDDVIVV